MRRAGSPARLDISAEGCAFETSLANCLAGLRKIGEASAPVGWQGATQPVVVQQQDLQHGELRVRAAPTGWEGLGEAVGVKNQQLQKRQGSRLSPGRWQWACNKQRLSLCPLTELMSFSPMHVLASAALRHLL